MIDYEHSKKEDINTLRDTFNELSWERILLSPQATEQKLVSLSLSELYSYIKTSAVPDENIERIVRSNINLWKFYRNTVTETAAFHMPEAMAASSQELPFTRQGENWVLTIELSRAEVKQVYIIFKFTEKINKAPSSIFFFKDNETPPRWELPKMHDGVIQLIADRKSDLVELLMDPKTEAYLR